MLALVASAAWTGGPIGSPHATRAIPPVPPTLRDSGGSPKVLVGPVAVGDRASPVPAGPAAAGPTAPAPADPSVSQIGVGVFPTEATVDPVNGYVYVPNLDSANVSVIDGTTVVASVSGLVSPRYATVDTSNGDVFVPSGYAGASYVTVIEGTRAIGNVSVGSEPEEPAYDPSDGYVYVPDEIAHEVSVLDGTTLVGSVTVPGDPMYATYDGADGDVYVAGFPGIVNAINGTTLVGTVTVGTDPDPPVFDPGDGELYVPNEYSDNVSVIDGTVIVGTVGVGVVPYSAGYDSGNGYIYVPNVYSSNVSVIDGTSVVATLRAGTWPDAVAYDAGNNHVYVANAGSGNVSVFNGTASAGSVEVGAAPEFPSYDAGSGFVYVADTSSDAVSAISTGFNVTFVENSLPFGTEWWVDVAGVPPAYSNNTMIASVEPNGTSVYFAGTADQNYSSTGGTFVIEGSSLWITLNYSLVEYPVAFSETGLPAGTNWSVELGTDTYASTTPTITLVQPNGTHAYRIGVVPGWTTARFTGTLSVAGAPVDASVAWSQVTYRVGWTEIGLPTDTGWWVNLTRGASGYSDTETLSMTAPNGTYTFSTSSSDRTYASPPGSFTVDGAPVAQSVTFAPWTYRVTFVETGLAAGTGWSVGLYVAQQTSTTATDAFAETNGTYSFVIGSVGGYTVAPSSGDVVVHGADVTTKVAFTPNPPATYTVAFSETGLPPGTRWSVTMDGSTQTGTGDLAFPGVPNGTYPFSVASVAGFVAISYNWSVTVDGPPAPRAVEFVPAPPPVTVLGLPAMEGYEVLGGTLTAVVAAIGVGALLHRGRRGPERPPQGVPSAPDREGPPETR
jgi:DNA-binding beta-propeller fold protein YncE